MGLQKGQTMDEFVKYLSRKGKSNFAKATDEEIKQLEEWGKGKLPKEFLYVETGSVYQCSHSLLSNENEINVYGFGRTKTLEFTYENVIGCSMKIADNYREFTEVLRKRRSIFYDVESYAADMYI